MASFMRPLLQAGGSNAATCGSNSSKGRAATLPTVHAPCMTSSHLPRVSLVHSSANSVTAVGAPPSAKPTMARNSRSHCRGRVCRWADGLHGVSGSTGCRAATVLWDHITFAAAAPHRKRGCQRAGQPCRPQHQRRQQEAAAAPQPIGHSSQAVHAQKHACGTTEHRGAVKAGLRAALGGGACQAPPRAAARAGPPPPEAALVHCALLTAMYDPF